MSVNNETNDLPQTDLYAGIREVLASAQTQARRAVNDAMVQAYWQIGRLIGEDEQGGEQRAAYGQSVLDGIAERLTAAFGRGFSLPNLRNFRQFYLTLCSERNAAVARYSQLASSPQLFASQYSLILPSEEDLRAELERDRALLEAAREDGEAAKTPEDSSFRRKPESSGAPLDSGSSPE